MITCDIDGKSRRFEGGAEQIIKWLAEGGASVFAVKGLHGSLRFDFHNATGKVVAQLDGIAQSHAPPSSNS